MTIKDIIITTLTFFLFTSNLLFAENQMEIMVELEGEHSASEFGKWSTALDFNGDGIDDLVICSDNYDPLYPGYPAEPEPWGKIYFYLGKENGFGDSTDLTLTLWTDSLKTGVYVENLGDMNGDGFEDLGYRSYYVAAIGDTSYYNVNILLGGCNPDTIPDYTFTFLLGNEWSGNRPPRLCWLGDVNGDGLDDAGLVIDDMDGYDNNMIIYGGSFELTTFKKFPVHNQVPFIYGAGDVNYDGFGDFIIGHMENSLIVNELYYGDTILDTIPDIILSDHISITQLNTCGGFYCGDWNADGIDDFIGNCNNLEGLGIWYGSNPQILGPQMTIDFYDWIPQRNYDFGDLNNDGKSDIVAGFYIVSGRFYCYLGCQNGTYDYYLLGDDLYYYENLGWSIAVGDFNGDNFDDIAAGAPALNNLWNFGKVIVLAGNADLVEVDPNVAIEDQVTPNYNINFDAYPNPFNPTITISFSLPEESDIELTIFNIKGQKVNTLVNSDLDKGNHSFVWSGNDESNEPVSSGVYFYKLKVNSKTEGTKKMLLLK